MEWVAGGHGMSGWWAWNGWLVGMEWVVVGMDWVAGGHGMGGWWAWIGWLVGMEWVAGGRASASPQNSHDVSLVAR